MTAELARLILAQICIHGSMAGLRMAAPLLALKQGYSPLAVGILLALFSLTQVFLSLPAGRFADRHGLRLPVQISVAAAVAGAGLAAAFPNFPMLCIAALLSGGATGAAVIALQRHVGRSAKGALQLKQVFSWLAIGPAISNFIGPFSAGLLIDLAGPVAGSIEGYRWAFLLLAVLPLISLLLVRAAYEGAQTVHGSPATVPAVAVKLRAWDLLREPTFRRLLLVNWFLSSCWDVHTFVVPVLGHEKGINASVIGSILGAFAIAATLVRLLLPHLAGRLREWRVLVGSMLATAALFAVYPLLPNALAMGACSVLLGIALGMVQPMIMSLLHQVTPEARHGEALGLRLMSINAMSVLMPLLFGSAGTLIGIAGIFWTTAAFVGAGSRLAWGLKGSAHSPAAQDATAGKNP